VIPYSSLRVAQLLVLLRAVAVEPCAHAAWQVCGLPISLRAACRWLVKWSGLTVHVRSYLHRMVSPPGKIDEINAVGTAITGGPPHRSVREVLPHTALALSRARKRCSG
jgi:hypothetical protein